MTAVARLAGLLAVLGGAACSSSNPAHQDGDVAADGREVDGETGAEEGAADTDVPVDGVDETSADGDEGDVPPEDGGACQGLGSHCTSGIDCCTGRCEPDVTGAYVCISAERCAGLGEGCAVAADCCSLGCDGTLCVASLCLVGGESCTAPAQCCSNRCVGGGCESGGACLPAGEDCSTGGSGSCCSMNCAEASDGRMRCLGLGRCRAEGEVCRENGDCCNYQCVDGFCLVQPECDVAGEACETNAACCSSLCADDGSGYRSCQYLGGCRPFGELCRSDGECCNNPANDGPGVCVTVAEGIGRCENPTGCAPAGELCGPGYHTCCRCATPMSEPGCPNPDASLFCLDTVFGVSRCFSDDCVLEGGPCDAPEDCCGGVCTAGVCGPGISCRENLEPCAFSDQCCCRVCAPDATGALVCCPGDTPCIAESGRCTTDADCCSGNCNADGICGPDETPCVPLGGSCTTDADCCSDYCDPGTHTCQTIIM
jgi:hypothetical protein